MSYLISLDLPLWMAFIPLAIAIYLASKYYKWKAKYYEAQHKAENNALRLIQDFGRYKSELEKHQSEIKSLKTEAVERESLIEQLNKQMQDIQVVSDARADYYENKQEMHIRASIEQDKEMQKLKSNDELRLLQIDELIETIGNLDQERKSLQADLAAAIAVINRTERGRRQWAKHQVKKSGEAVQKAVEKLQSDEVVYDSVGVPRIVKADQSENDNGRHDVFKLSNEVVRGVKEQAQAIRNELQADKVDLGTLQKGDSVKLRDGKVLQVTKFVQTVPNSKFYTGLQFSDGSTDFYMQDGSFWADKAYCLSDIIQIIKKELASVVDLSELKVGDSIEFRDKSIGVVTRISVNDGSMPYFIRFKIGGKQTRFHFYFRNGFWADDKEPSSGDIVRIIKKNSHV